MSKIVCIDDGNLTHTSIYAWEAIYKGKIEAYKRKNDVSFEEAKEAIDDLVRQRKIYISEPNYLYFQSLISALKRIGIYKDDIIILARDKSTSWRKIFANYYKDHRKKDREKHKLIDWKKWYAQIDRLVNQIDESTNFHILWMPKVFNYLDILPTKEGEKFLDINEINDLEFEFGEEADDIIATIPKVFSDKECIIVGKDVDLDMLAVYSNVKIYTMNVKYRGGTGVYKIINNGYKVLDEKIRKGDISDNIIIPENDTEKDREIRKLIIDLINLPEWVQRPIKEVLENLPEKKCDFSKLPFPRSLAKRFPQIYENDKIITYEDSVKRLERKKVRAKNKKEKLKKESTMRKIK